MHGVSVVYVCARGTYCVNTYTLRRYPVVKKEHNGVCRWANKRREGGREERQSYDYLGYMAVQATLTFFLVYCVVFLPKIIL